MFGNNIKLFLIFLTVFLIVGIAIKIRSNDAVSGIVWGYKSVICDSKFEFLKKNCNIDWKNLSINFGVYDPEGHFDSINTIAIEHRFIKWTEYQKGQLDDFFNHVSSKNRWPMITIEPFSFDNSDESKRSLFDDIASGKYDEAIETICLDFKNSKNPVFIRWGQEMENVTGRYPWASNDTSGYIASYRYFVNKCREIDGKNFYIWSPVGHSNVKGYYPGGGFVDLVGLSVFEFPQWDINNYGKTQSFDEIFSQRYRVVKGFEKPIIIAELGVTGDKDFQKSWLINAINSSQKYPLLKTVSYFDAVDSPGVWREKYPTPDWRINPEIFTSPL